MRGPFKLRTVICTVSRSSGLVMDLTYQAREFYLLWEEIGREFVSHSPPAAVKPPTKRTSATAPRRRKNVGSAEINRLGRLLEEALLSEDSGGRGRSMPWLEEGPETHRRRRMRPAPVVVRSPYSRPWRFEPWVRRPTRPIPVHRHLPRIPTVPTRREAEAELVDLMASQPWSPGLIARLRQAGKRSRIRGRDGLWYRVPRSLDTPGVV